MFFKKTKLFTMSMVLVMILCLATGCIGEKPSPLQDQVSQAIAQGFDHVSQQQKDFTTRNETTDDDVFLCAQSGRLTNEQQVAYLETLSHYLSSGQAVDKITQWQDMIFAVVACGGDPTDVAGINLVEKVAGYDLNDSQNYSDFYVYLSQLLVIGNRVGQPVDQLIALQRLLATQNSDGAFVDEWGTTLDSTALALEALALFSDDNHELIAQAKEKAIIYLSQQQDKNGYYNFSAEPSIPSTAQVCLALVGLGIDPAQDERFVSKLGNVVSGLVDLYQAELAKGEKADYYNITQGLMGLVAYDRYLKEMDYYYAVTIPAPIEDASSPQLETQPDQAEPLAILTEPEPPATPANEPSAVVQPQGLQVSLTIVGPEEVGTILDSTLVDIEEGDTVYQVLRKATKAIKMPVESSGGEGKAYIEGINNVYELDYGATSGWLYCVDDSFPSKSSGQYQLKGGEAVRWVYTLDMGKDVGAPAGVAQ